MLDGVVNVDGRRCTTAQPEVCQTTIWLEGAPSQAAGWLLSGENDTVAPPRRTCTTAPSLVRRAVMVWVFATAAVCRRPSGET